MARSNNQQKREIVYVPPNVEKNWYDVKNIGVWNVWLKKRIWTVWVGTKLLLPIIGGYFLIWLVGHIHYICVVLHAISI